LQSHANAIVYWAPWSGFIPTQCEWCHWIAITRFILLCWKWYFNLLHIKYAYGSATAWNLFSVWQYKIRFIFCFM